MSALFVLAVWFAALRVAVHVTVWVIVALLAMLVAVVRGLVVLSMRLRSQQG